MKKVFFILLVIFIYNADCFSQQKSYFFITAGPSIPIGEFANKDLMSSSSGLAGVGQSLNISFAKVSPDKIGFAFELRGQRNPLSEKAVRNSLNNAKFINGGFSTGIPSGPPSFTTYPDWKVEKKSWWSVAATGGLYTEIPAFNSKNISFSAKALVGGIYVKSPLVDATSTTDTTMAHFEQTSESAFGFTYNIGGALHFDTGKKLFFVAGFDYIGTNKLTFDNVEAKLTTSKGEFGDPGYSISQTQARNDGHQALTAININVGIGLRHF